VRIVINALSARRGGSQTHIASLLRYFGDSYESEIFIFLPDYVQIPTHPRIKRMSAGWPTENPVLRAFWERFVFRKILASLKPDVLFCPGGLISTIPPADCKTVTMSQNMIPFDLSQRKRYPPGWERLRNWLLESSMSRSMLKADLVIFISDYAQKTIQKRLDNGIKNTITIPHGLDEKFKVLNNTLSRPAWLPEKEYFLYVSAFDVYRNQLEVVQGFALFKKAKTTPEILILVGHNDSSYGRQVRGEIKKLGLEKDVILTGNIPHGELPAVYGKAKVIIFSSECENCPNILLESMGAGRPVICSDRPPMPEFGGEAVLYFNPSSPGDLSEKLAFLADHPAIMEELAIKARERALGYDWGKAARSTWNAILKINP